MTLNQLRYFLAVYRHGSITKAARILIVSQPSISNAIKDLEDELGFLLLNREKSRLMPTEAGKIFYQTTSELFDRLESTINYLRQIETENLESAVYLGVPPISGVCVLPYVYRSISQAFPNMTIKLVEEHYQKLQQMVLTELIDCTLSISSGVRYEGLSYLPLVRLDVCYCVSANSELARRQRIDAQDILDRPLLSFVPGYHFDLAMQFYQRHQHDPKILLQSERQNLIEELLAAQPEVGAFLIKAAIVRQDVVPIYCDELLFTDVAIAYKTDSVLSSALKQFIGLFKDNPLDMQNKYPPKKSRCHG